MLRHAITFCLLFCITMVASAEIRLGLNENHNFLLIGDGEQLSGLNFESNGGGLRPIPPGDLTASAAPFTFLLANTERQITYGNLGASVRVDGVIELGAGWNASAGVDDLEFAYGIGAQQVNISNPVDFNVPCANCPTPPLSFSLNEDRKVIVSGSGQQVQSLTLLSESDSLVYNSAGPFSNTVDNAPDRITLGSNAGLTIDGDVELDIQWNDHLYNRDIEYEYTLLEGDSVGPRSIPSNGYNFQLPSFPELGVTVNEEYQLVLNGTGQPLSSLTFFSPQRKLIGPETPAFGRTTTNVPGRIDIVPLGSSFKVDGELVLNTSWDPLGAARDISVKYDLLGDLEGAGYRLPLTAYPDVPDHVRLGIDPITITLDDQNRFVLTGNGQQVNGIEFVSEAGALTLSDNSTAPFPFVLTNSAEHVALGILQTSAEILGSYVLDFGPKTADDLDNIVINVGYGATSLKSDTDFVCANCDFPAVTVDEDRVLVFRDFPELITEFQFTSNEIGLEDLTLPEGITLTRPSPNEVLLTSAEGFGPDQLSGLAVSWGVSDDQQVFVSYTLASGVSFGPLPLSLNLPSPAVPEPAVPEPSAHILLLLGLLCLRRIRRV